MNPAIIVNPAAGAGSAAREWPAVARQLGAIPIRFTERPGHATELVRELLHSGFDPIIAAGGDGTLHEIANAILRGNCSVRLGVIPLASGGDFARTLGLSRVNRALEVLRLGRVRPVDVIRLRFECGECFAVNAAGIGLSAKVASGSRRWPRVVPGMLRYLLSVVAPLASGDAYDIRVSTESAPAREYRITTAALANGKYQGGGICIAPAAAVDDGLMDLTIVEQVSLMEVCLHLRLLYSGKLLTYRKVRHAKALRVRVESAGCVPVEVDGELAGTLPVEAEIVPRALRLLA